MPKPSETVKRYLDGASDQLDDSISEQLSRRREIALKTKVINEPSPKHGWIAVATAASVSLVVGSAVWVQYNNQVDWQKNVAMLDAHDELVADLDFYVWLMEQEDAL